MRRRVRHLQRPRSSCINQSSRQAIVSPPYGASPFCSFATLLAFSFLYGLGGCAPWGPSPLRSQARFALPPAPTPRTGWAAQRGVRRARFRLSADRPLARRVPLAYRMFPPSETHALGERNAFRSPRTDAVLTC